MTPNTRCRGLCFLDDKFFNGDAADQVFGDDALERCGCARVVPYAFGVDDGDGALLANPKTVCFGAVDAPALREVELGKPPLEILP